MKLNHCNIEKLFTKCDDQQDVLVGLYRMIFPDWDNIKKIDGWPTISPETGAKICQMFMEFDRKHHPQVLNGGLWLNHGFSSLNGHSLDLWEVDISTCTKVLITADRIHANKP